MNILGQQIVFFREFWRGKDDLCVRKDDFDAVLFLSTTPRIAESGSRQLSELFFYNEYWQMEI